MNVGLSDWALTLHAFYLRDEVSRGRRFSRALASLASRLNTFERKEGLGF